MIEIILGVVLFTAIVLTLVGVILLARSKLVAQGSVAIVVNEQRTLEAPVGGKLIGALADAGLYVSSACGGGGTCGQCKVKVLEGGGVAAAHRSLARHQARGAGRHAAGLPGRRQAADEGRSAA